MHFRTVIRNIFSTWVGYAATLLVGFFLAPFVVHHLGANGYGVWTLVVSLTGYFGMLDMGLRQSVGRYVARFMAMGDEQNVNRTVSSALMMLGAGGVLALTATVLMSLAFAVFKVDAHLAVAARIALLIAGVNISLALPLSVFNAVLFSMERFDIVTAITILGALTRAALVFVFLTLGYGVIALAVITLAGSCAEYAAAGICAKRLYPLLRFNRQLIDVDRCKELFRFGIYRFVWIVANQVIFYTDSVVIGAFLNVGAITVYAIAGSLINYGRNIVSLATDTFAPAATRLDANQDVAGLRNLQIAGTQISLIIGLPICFGYLFLGEQFVTLWMGPAYMLSVSVLAVLTIPQFTSMSQYISSLILVGMARHQVLAKVAIIEAIANLVLSIVLVRKLGVIGVAWGTVVPHAITTAVVLPLYTLRTLDLPLSEYLRRGFIRPVLCALPAGALCYTFGATVKTASWAVFAAEVACVCAVAGVLAFLFCLTAGQRTRIVEELRSRVQKRAAATVA